MGDRDALPTCNTCPARAAHDSCSREDAPRTTPCRRRPRRWRRPSDVGAVMGDGPHRLRTCGAHHPTTHVNMWPSTPPQSRRRGPPRPPALRTTTPRRAGIGRRDIKEPKNTHRGCRQDRTWRAGVAVAGARSRSTTRTDRTQNPFRRSRTLNSNPHFFPSHLSLRATTRSCCSCDGSCSPRRWRPTSTSKAHVRSVSLFATPTDIATPPGSRSTR